MAKTDEKKEDKKEEAKPTPLVTEKSGPKAEPVKEEKKEEKKEEPLATTVIPSSYGASYQQPQATQPYGAPAPQVKLKDISQGQQSLPGYPAPAGTTAPKPYGSDISKQKINPYMP